MGRPRGVGALDLSLPAGCGKEQSLRAAEGSLLTKLPGTPAPPWASVEGTSPGARETGTTPGSSCQKSQSVLSSFTPAHPVSLPAAGLAPLLGPTAWLPIAPRTLADGDLRQTHA